MACESTRNWTDFNSEFLYWFFDCFLSLLVSIDSFSSGDYIMVEVVFKWTFSFPFPLNFKRKKVQVGSFNRGSVYVSVACLCFISPKSLKKIIQSILMSMFNLKLFVFRYRENIFLPQSLAWAKRPRTNIKVVDRESQKVWKSWKIISLWGFYV